MSNRGPSSASQGGTSNPLTPETFVNLNFRYAGSWAEYNQRLISRSQILGLYVSASGLLIGFLYSKRDENPITFCVMSFVIPIASLVSSLLFYMHDSIMAELHVFMIKCEKAKNDTPNGLSLPGYHDSVVGVQKFLRARHLHNVIVLTIYFLNNLSPLFIYFHNIIKRELYYSGPFWIVAMIYFLLFCHSWLVIIQSMDKRVEALEPYIGTFESPRFFKRLLYFYGNSYKRVVKRL